MTCAEMDMLVHPYLDGEIVAEERVLFDKHVAGCARCRGLLGHEATFRQHLRARLRPRAEAVVPPALRRRISEALDRADAGGEGPVRPFWRVIAPGAGALLTAAAVAFFFGIGALKSRVDDAGLVEQAIAGHMKNLPVEVGGTDDDISVWMRGKVAVPVRPPNLAAVRLHIQRTTPRLIGARISHLASRDAGQIVYRVGNSQVTVYVFDPSGWQMSAAAQRIIDGREVFFAERAGYSVAFYRDRGIGYALASDLDEGDLMNLVEAALRE